MNLQDKVVLITGASRGIGAQIAKSFAQTGAFVIVNYLKSHHFADQVIQEIEIKGGKGVAMQANVQKEEDVNEMMETILDNFGAIDVVVNNALSHYSFNPRTRSSAWQISWKEYQNQFEGSVHGAYNVCQAALPHMKNQMSGRIINMVTNLIDFPIIPYHDYTTAKSALLGFTRNLAKDLGAFGITVNAVAPGLTYPTDSSQDTREDVRNEIIRMTPLRRLATPEDVAGPVLFLASDYARFVTGQCLRVDGGLVMS